MVTIATNKSATFFKSCLQPVIQTHRVPSRQFSGRPTSPKQPNSLTLSSTVKTTHNFKTIRNHPTKQPYFGSFAGTIVVAIVTGTAAWFFGTLRGLFPEAKAEESTDNSSVQEDFASKPWHLRLSGQISSDSYRYSSPQKMYELEALYNKVQEGYGEKAEEFHKNHPEIPQLYQDDSLTMSTIAIMAAYLKARKGIDNLFICKSLEAFQTKLNEVGKSEGDIRLALIMADCPETKDADDPKDGEYGIDPGHKVSVCIEKKGSKIKLALLDPLGIEEDEFSPKLVQASADQLKFCDDEDAGSNILFWYIYHSGLNLKETSIYYSPIERQKTEVACETFALKDGIDFLQDPEFFQHLKANRLKIGRAHV